MDRRVFMTALPVLAVAATRPAALHAQTAADGLQAIVQRGELMAGVQTQGPPNSFMDRNGKRVGFMVDIVAAMAADMGVTLRMADYDFRGLIPAATSGKVDLIAADLAPTPQRELVLLFTDPVYEEAVVLYGKHGRATAGLSALDRQGVRLGVVAGSANKSILQRQFPHATIVELAGGGPELLQAVASERVDAAINVRSSAEANIASSPGEFEIIGDDLYSWPESFGVRPEQTHLLAWMNNWIYWAKRDDRLKTMAAYWRRGQQWRPDHL
jgi:polar amino acid transport system substrate-binding protein